MKCLLFGFSLPVLLYLLEYDTYIDRYPTLRWYFFVRPFVIFKDPIASPMLSTSTGSPMHCEILSYSHKHCVL